MGIIQKIISKHKEKVRARNDMCDNLIMQIDTALQEMAIIILRICSLLLSQAKNQNGIIVILL